MSGLYVPDNFLVVVLLVDLFRRLIPVGFNIVLLLDENSPTYPENNLPERLRELIPDINVDVCYTVDEAMKPIENADAAFGFISPTLFERAKKIKWIACPMAGPPAGYYHQALIDSNVVVTNVRGIFSDHISAHIMSYVLAFARGIHIYLPQQLKQEWSPSYKTLDLSQSTVLMVGLGGIGSETARLCSEFGMSVVGVDARLNTKPDFVKELHGPEELYRLLPYGDFVIVTVPETPETQGLFAMRQFESMRKSAFFINVGRGATVIIDDLADALHRGEIAGAGLDVFQEEPLPAGHKLWNAPGALVTPHVAAIGPDGFGYLRKRAASIFIENCIRFNEGNQLKNIVDKANWF